MKTTEVLYTRNFTDLGPLQLLLFKKNEKSFQEE